MINPLARHQYRVTRSPAEVLSWLRSSLAELAEIADRLAVQREAMRQYFIDHPPPPPEPDGTPIIDEGMVAVRSPGRGGPWHRLADSEIDRIRSVAAANPHLGIGELARVIGRDPHTIRRYTATTEKR